PPGSRVFVVAGIARPDRFAADVGAAGWDIAGMMTFRDHHRYDARDLKRIVDAAKAARSAIVLTTEKDAGRLAPFDLAALPIAAVPLVVGVEPAERFKTWLLDLIQPPAPSSQLPVHS